MPSGHFKPEKAAFSGKSSDHSGCESHNSSEERHAAKSNRFPRSNPRWNNPKVPSSMQLLATQALKPAALDCFDKLLMGGRRAGKGRFWIFAWSEVCLWVHLYILNNRTNKPSKPSDWISYSLKSILNIQSKSNTPNKRQEMIKTEWC